MSKPESQAIDREKIKDIIKRIVYKEDEKAQINVEIAAIKKECEEAGVTKKQLEEALRLYKRATDERNTTLSVANQCLKAAGKSEIDLTCI